MRGMCGWNQPHLIQLELVTCVDCDPQMAVVKRRESAAKDADRLHEALIRARSFSAPNRRPSRPTSSRSDLRDRRSAGPTSELQSPMRNSYAISCVKTTHN